MNTAEELAKLKELNEDKFNTINAYCRMASMDKWKIKTLVDAIDDYLRGFGTGDPPITPQIQALSEAREKVINSKTGLLP